MNLKIMDLAFDSLLFFSSLFALLAAIVLMAATVFFPKGIMIHVIGETLVLAFFGAWGLLDWYHEVR